MPHRWIYIPKSALDELGRLGFKPREGDYREVFYEGQWYLEFESKKGDIGAIFGRRKLHHIGLLVEIARSYGAFESDKPIQPYNRTNSIGKTIPEEPRQLYLPHIFNSTPYDETSHLTPDGKKRRKRR
jgi:hypothetical protein